MKILIIEDEYPAARKLIRLLEETEQEIRVIDILKSVEQATNWFAENKSPDLIFMDIQLEDGLSFEIFETCRITTPVIFTTAYDEYTLKAFKVNSVDYLLKPIRPDDLRAAIHKYKTYHRPHVGSFSLETIVRQLQPRTKERFLVKIGEHYRSIPVVSINAFFILERNTFFQTDKGKTYPLDFSLDKIEQIIDTTLFFRVNRNYIVRFQAIRDVVIYSSNRLKLLVEGQEDSEILVSRERVSSFKNWMDR